MEFQAGQAPTADELTALVPGYVVQGTQQDVASSTTLEDSNIVVPIDGLCEVRLSVRYHHQGGGIRWAWRATGTADMASRDILSAGENASGGVHDISDMRFRQIVTLDQPHDVTSSISGATSHMISERCICTGEGEIVFQFAQNVSHADATQVLEASFATVQPLREL
ncbi:hypothetical protein ACFQZ2_01835 [Streptomonospora algeriensis]|uniref:Uncharacterized protein n=1 Tax=Streptomonospora algeriensis TaxID=995084 RepID=A0ABW3BCU8_9ACTN